MEEVFFLQYYLHQDRNITMSMPINERKWMIHKLIEVKQKENDEIEKASKKHKG